MLGFQSPTAGNAEGLSDILTRGERIRPERFPLCNRSRRKGGFLECSPLVVFLIPFAHHASLLALHTRGFCLITFQSLFLACHTTCDTKRSVSKFWHAGSY